MEGVFGGGGVTVFGVTDVLGAGWVVCLAGTVAVLVLLSVVPNRVEAFFGGLNRLNRGRLKSEKSDFFCGVGTGVAVLAAVVVAIPVDISDFRSGLKKI